MPRTSFRGVTGIFNLAGIVPIVVLLIASWQLLLPPVLGLADNGDFARVMVFFDLTHAPKEWGDRYFGFFDRQYVFDRIEANQYATPDLLSSEAVFVWPALVLNRLVNRSSFDLLFLGWVHIMVFAACTYLLLAASKGFEGPLRTTGVILGTLVFTDIGYISYFNSFYGESASFLFFLLLVGCAYATLSSSKHRMAWTGAYFVAVTGFVMAKYQNLPLLPVFLFFGWLLVKRLGDMKYFHAYLVLSLLACYGAYRIYISSPAVVDEAVLYNSVFNGVLVDSPSPEADLEALGLKPELAKYAGTTAFSHDSPRYNGEFMQYFRQSVTIGKVVEFYATRIPRLLGTLDRAVRLAAQTRPTLGNYEKVTGFPPGSQSKTWAMWSSIRAHLLPKSLWFVLLVSVVYVALLGRKWREEKSKVTRLSVEWLTLIPVMALIQLFIIAVADGISDVIKHAFLFNLMFDYMLVVLAAQLLTRVAAPSHGEIPSQEGLL